MTGPFKIDFAEDAVLEWHRTSDGVDCQAVTDYTRTCYLEASADVRETARAWLTETDGVAECTQAQKYTSLRDDEPTTLLAVHVHHTTDPQAIARRFRRDVERPELTPGTARWYNVDLAPQFRYCLEQHKDPTPSEPGTLETVSIALDEKSIADGDVSATTIGDEPIDGGETAVLEALADTLVRVDPDVLVVSAAQLVPLLTERALACGVDLQLGRRPGWERLAGANTYESYGRVGHSAARYNVPGRVLLDTSNSFLWPESSLAGLLYLVEESHKPLQETAWGSIGNILTSIQIREATDRDVVVPWQKWEPEAFKDLQTLHDADRGGFIMDPTVGFHENVYELDFSSLYPSIMCEYNISPDTILCDCHADRADIPGLGYNVCDEPGFIADVLGPLIDRRTQAKETIRQAGADEDCRDARAISGAIKWILVSCFGYQGYRNSKFGRIECHEAINAVARDIFLSAKDALEAAGWTVVHGIVDSVWVAPTSDTGRTPIETVARAISEDVGITLECEARYDWVAFVPRRGTDRGALTRYVAKRADVAEFKYRGIEVRQRSTCPFVADVQRDLVRALDRHRAPEPVVDRAAGHARMVRRGEIPTDELVITKRVSKPLGAYTQATHNVAALERAERAGVAKRPGQSVSYVVVDDDARTSARVRLPFEAIPTYDADYYEERLWRAVESVVSPLGWDREAIDRYRRSTTDTRLTSFSRIAPDSRN